MAQLLWGQTSSYSPLITPEAFHDTASVVDATVCACMLWQLFLFHHVTLIIPCLGLSAIRSTFSVNVIIAVKDVQPFVSGLWRP